MKINKIKKLFPRGKLGINDISIIAVITFIFLSTAIIIPFVNAEFGTTSSTFDEEQFTEGIRQDAKSISTLSAFSVLTTTLKLAFFDFGNSLRLPFWLDAVYTILGVIFILVVARNLWVGGGA